MLKTAQQTLNQLAALLVFILLISLSFYKNRQAGKQDPLSEIREWALQQQLWPNLAQQDPPALIAVRQIYKIEQNNLKLNAYLLVPCPEICGQSASCAQSCQNQIQSWQGESSQALLMIEGYDTKNTSSLGRLVLKDIAPIKLRYWSRKHSLIALIQTKSEQEHTLHLIKLKQKGSTALDSDLPSNAQSSTQSNTEPNNYLEYYDQLNLGPFHGEESPLEGSVSFRDINTDKQLELLAPLESLVKLKPMAVFLPSPYELGELGLKLAPHLIKLTPPKPDELRNWLLAVRGTDEVAITNQKIKATLSFSLLLCLKGPKLCDKGADLVSYAYPQHEHVHRLWVQLRRFVENSRGQTQSQAKMQSQNKPTSPYSLLDQ